MRKNRFFPVIHVVDKDQALRNAKIAFENGADGVFLINHDVASDELVAVYKFLRSELGQERWIGLNFLRISPQRAIDLLPVDASAIWMDDIGFRESEHLGKVEETGSFRDRLSRNGHKIPLFGGLDFKYQKPIQDLPKAVKFLARVVEVITTSGVATGIAPSLEKTKIMRTSLEATTGSTARIAVASGMTAGNVGCFLDSVDDFLVATGISLSYSELSPVLTREMADKMHR